MRAAVGSPGPGGRDDPQRFGPAQAPGHPHAPLPLTAGNGYDSPPTDHSDHPGAHSRRPAPRCAGLAGPQAIRQAEFLGLDLGKIRTDRTRSGLEADFLRLCRRHHLPIPEVNQRIGPYTVDFLWRAQCLVVETDGYAAHRGREAFEDDRERELHLRELGYQVLRFSDVQVERKPVAVAAAVRAGLG